MKIVITFLVLFFTLHKNISSSGYDLRLRYDKISNETILRNYKNQIKAICFNIYSETQGVAKEELLRGLKGLLDTEYKIKTSFNKSNTLVIANKNNLDQQILNILKKDLANLKKDGFLVMHLKF